MTSPVWIAFGAAVLTGGLLVEVLIFRAMHDDKPSIYKLFALRDELVRLVVEGKVKRHQAHFNALYENVSILLHSSRRISGPKGWDLAEAQGKLLAREPNRGATLSPLPKDQMPESLVPIVRELREALEHLIANHLGVIVHVDSRRRELARIQRAQANAFLKMMREGNASPVGIS